MTRDDSNFAATLNASLANVISIWKSAGALKEMLDRRIQEAFQKHGFVPKNGNVVSHEVGGLHDDWSGVCLKWAWAYPVKVPTKGRSKVLGHLYCWIALTPSYAYAGYESVFQPYIAFNFEIGPPDYGCDWSEYYLDHDHPLSEEEFARINLESIDLFSESAMWQSKYASEMNPEFRGFDVYFPLNSITSANVGGVVIEPLVTGIKALIEIPLGAQPTAQ